MYSFDLKTKEGSLTFPEGKTRLLNDTTESLGTTARHHTSLSGTLADRLQHIPQELPLR